MTLVPLRARGARPLGASLFPQHPPPRPSSSLQTFLPVRGSWLVVALLLWLLGGCASRPPTSTAEPIQVWSGRLSLQVEATPATASQRFTAGFELRGGPSSGELVLQNPLGLRLALLRWQPGLAELLHGERHESAANLDDLLQALTGTALPIGPMFGWLRGEPTAQDGWQVDLSQHAQGRLTALRLDPAPQATLRLVIDRP